MDMYGYCNGYNGDGYPLVTEHSHGTWQVYEFIIFMLNTHGHTSTMVINDELLMIVLSSYQFYGYSYH